MLHNQNPSSFKIRNQIRWMQYWTQEGNSPDFGLWNPAVRYLFWPVESSSPLQEGNSPDFGLWIQFSEIISSISPYLWITFLVNPTNQYSVKITKCKLESGIYTYEINGGAAICEAARGMAEEGHAIRREVCTSNAFGNEIVIARICQWVPKHEQRRRMIRLLKPSLLLQWILQSNK